MKNVIIAGASRSGKSILSKKISKEFGHTHIPRPWENDKRPATLPFEVTGGRIVKLMNCGGWLKDENEVFCGANVFKYQTGTPQLEVVAVQ